MRSRSNREIMDGIVAGDEVILKSFYKRNLPYVRKYILRHQGNDQDVEDIFQDALVIIYQKLREDSRHINTTVSSYFYGVCKNLWRSQLRKKREYAGNSSLFYDTKFIEDTNVDNIICQEQEGVYQRHFSKLGTGSKKMLRLFFEGKNTRNVASTMGYTERYARKKKCIAKKQLTSMIKQDPMYEKLVSYQARN